MNAEEFEKAIGRKPEDDDLDRANCKLAGHAGHKTCGICKHGKPVFECQDCFASAVAAPVMDTNFSEHLK